MKADDLLDNTIIYIPLIADGLRGPFIPNRPPHLDCVVVQSTNKEVKEAIKTFEEAHPDVDTNKAAKARAMRILKDVKKNITKYSAAQFQRIYDAQVVCFIP